jgi:hypothetical protein
VAVQVVVIAGRAVAQGAVRGGAMVGRAGARVAGKVAQVGARGAQKAAGSAGRTASRAASRTASRTASRSTRPPTRARDASGPGRLRQTLDDAQGRAGGTPDGLADLGSAAERLVEGATRFAGSAARAPLRGARGARGMARKTSPRQRALRTLRRRRRRRKDEERDEQRRRRVRRAIVAFVLLSFAWTVFGLPLMTSVISPSLSADELDQLSAEPATTTIPPLPGPGGTLAPPYGGTAPPYGPMGSTQRYTESRITPTMQRVLDVVVPIFGRGHGIGCFRHQDDGEHPKGRACDFIMQRPLNQMPTPQYQAHGWAFSNYLVANADTLDIMYVIWQKQIWSAARADEGWRPYTRYPNGNLQQNHYDHVHVSVY